MTQIYLKLLSWNIVMQLHSIYWRAFMYHRIKRWTHSVYFTFVNKFCQLIYWSTAKKLQVTGRYRYYCTSMRNYFSKWHKKLSRDFKWLLKFCNRKYFPNKTEKWCLIINVIIWQGNIKATVYRYFWIKGQINILHCCFLKRIWSPRTRRDSPSIIYLVSDKAKIIEFVSWSPIF